jgi:hypothetical protein
VFRAVRRGSHVRPSGLRGADITLIVEKGARAAGLDASQFSAHSTSPIAGFSDDQQYLCLRLALWNEHDPIYYLDGTPSHSWMQMLYKYPQEAFPYAQLVAENQRRGADEPEFKLLDTGVFDDDRYFDVKVTYAKATTDDILMEVVATNRGHDAAVGARCHICYSRARGSVGTAQSSRVGRPAMVFCAAFPRKLLDLMPSPARLPVPFPLPSVVPGPLSRAKEE